MFDYVSTYLEFANDLMNNGINLHDISQQESFHAFRKNNLINFGNAAKVDQELFGYSGGYWTSAFGYPREGDDVYRDSIYLGKAINVGLLTFDIDY